MFCNEEQIVLKLMLQKLNKGQRQIGEEEIKMALQTKGGSFFDDDDDDFCSSEKILKHFQDLRLIYRRRGCPLCDILVDIASLRALFLPEKEPESTESEKRVNLNELLETEWFLEKSEWEFDENEEDGAFDTDDTDGEERETGDTENDRLKDLCDDFKEHLKKTISEGEEDGDSNDEKKEAITAEQLLQKEDQEKALIDELLVKDYNIDMSDNEQFEGAVMDIIEAITALDPGNTRRDAIRICKELLRRAKISRERALFERAHKEFSIATDDEYEMLRKQIFGE